MQCLQPVDPDQQKQSIQKRYDTRIQQAIKSFSMDIQQRAIYLCKHVSIFGFSIAFSRCVGTHTDTFFSEIQYSHSTLGHLMTDI